MSKKTEMFLCLLLIVSCLSGCGKPAGRSVCYYRDGTVLAKNVNLLSVKEEKNQLIYSLVSTALTEAIADIAASQGISKGEAEKRLNQGIYRVETTFEKEKCTPLIDAFSKSLNKNTPFSAVITEPEGAVLAVISGGEERKNFTLQKTNPYSSLKPLAIYAPAMESGKIFWSTVYEDSPYKKVIDASGMLSDWPTNADGTYQNANVSVSKAIRKSLNTVAVKCLSSFGVERSMDFLTKNFGIDLNDEKTKSNVYDPDEIIGNIALGYLSQGVSPLDMTGFYQIFLNDGKYQKPYTVTKITDRDGKVVYEHKAKTKQVISPTTAFLMRKLLEGVVTADGTGKDAAVSGKAIAGKTGTGVSGDGNWFIGFTPSYLCSVWHGSGEYKNISPAIFAQIVTDCSLAPDHGFRNAAGVKQAAFCAESGLLLTNNCRKMETGYFASDHMPEACNIHNS